MSRATTAARGILRTARPRQWVKNVLVAAGPIAAGTITEVDVLSPVAVAFVAFCLAASAVYLLNDVLDVEADRAHPVKRNRPIAAGVVSPRSAVVTATALVAIAHAGTLALGYWELTIVLAAYTALQIAYCVSLKHQPVLDLAVVSSGFLLRAVGGGVAVGVTLSPYFLLVASFGSLFMVAGKRYSEVHLVGDGEYSTRRSLELYSQSYLRFVWSIAAATTIVFYGLWAFSFGDSNGLSETLSEISIAPFVIALLRYAVDIDRGAAGEPEDIVFKDRVLQLLGLIWLALFTAGALTR